MTTIEPAPSGPLGFTWQVTLPSPVGEGYRAVTVNADELSVHGGTGQLVFWEWEGLERKCILQVFDRTSYRTVTILNPDGTVGGLEWAPGPAEV